MNNSIISIERRRISLVLILSIFLQILTMVSVNIYADSAASIEIVLTDSQNNPISDAKLKISKQGVKDLKFIKDNGVYKEDDSGYYTEIVTGSYGDVIVTDLDIGVYNIHYVKNNETKAIKNFEITNKAEFKQIEFKLDGNSAGSQTEDIEPEDVIDDSLVLNFNSRGVDYRIEDESKRPITFTKTNKGYIHGGTLDSIKSGKDVNISSLDYGIYYIIGQGKRYKINYNRNKSHFNIVDEVIDVVETIIDTGSMNISIKNIKDDKAFRGAEFEVLDENNRPVTFRRVGTYEYRYDENGDVNDFVFNRQEIQLKGMPVGFYNVVDIDDDIEAFEDTEVEVIKDKTAIVTIRKGVIENDLFLRSYVKNDDEKEYLSGFIFNMISEDGGILKFSHDEENDVYIFDEDGDEDIETLEDGVSIEGIPFNQVSLVLIKSPEGFEEDVDEIELDLQDIRKYDYEASYIEYSLSITNIDDEPIEDVVVSIKDLSGKEVGKNISDKDGIVKFGMLDDEKYTISIMSVPSPYSLPNQGEDIKVMIDEKQILINEVVNNEPLYVENNLDEETANEDELSEDNNDGNTVDAEEDTEDNNENFIISEFAEESLVIPYASFIATTSTGKEGSIFSFVDKDGEEVYRLISEEDGSVKIDKIDHGEYVVTQLTVADGYRIDQDKYKLTIDGNYVSKEHVFENPKIGGEIVEDVKEDNRSLVTVLIILLIFLSLAAIYVSNEKHKEEYGENKYRVFDKLDELLGDKDEFDILDEDEINDLKDIEEDSFDSDLDREKSIEKTENTTKDIDNDKVKEVPDTENVQIEDTIKLDLDNENKNSKQ